MLKGIDYFPLDCQFNEAMELIEAEYGFLGFTVIIKIWQRIYSGYGYYCEWTEKSALLFARRIGADSAQAVSAVIAAAIDKGFFDRTLYEQYQILSSAGIQRRYLLAVSRRKQVMLQKEYLLLPVDDLPKNVCILGDSGNNADQNASNFQQRKEKERKEKERKEKERKAEENNPASAAASAKQYGLYSNISLSAQEYAALSQEFGIENLQRYIERMSSFQQEKGRIYANHAQKLRDWMLADRIEKPPEHSYQLEAYKALMNQF